MGMSRKGFRRGMAKLMKRGYSKDKAYAAMVRLSRRPNLSVTALGSSSWRKSKGGKNVPGFVEQRTANKNFRNLFS